MRVIIEQPTYLSWMGYFGMMELADTFVFYDDVAFDRQSWQQRNRIKSPVGQMMWLTVPVIRNFGQKISEVKINNSFDWRRKHWLTICQSYSQSPYFNKYRNEIQEIYNQDWEYLSDLNIYIIMKLARLFGLKIPNIVKSSAIIGVSGHKTDRLIMLLTKLDTKEYISGYGTKGYIEPRKFEVSNIKLYWYEYNPPVYPQIHGEFIPYLSAIDLLFNAGEKSMQYIKEGLKSALTLDLYDNKDYNKVDI